MFPKTSKVVCPTCKGVKFKYKHVPVIGGTRLTKEECGMCAGTGKVDMFSPVYINEIKEGGKNGN